MPRPAEPPPPRTVVLRPASPVLAPFVSSLGYLAGDFAHTRERALPSGAMQLLVNLDRDQFCTYDAAAPATAPPVQQASGAVLQGPSAEPCGIDPAEQRRVLWVSFRLGGAYPFLPAPAAEVADQLADLDQFWGRDGAVLRERLLAAGSPEAMLRTLEEVLVRRAVRPLAGDPAVAFATAALHRGATVADVSDRLGWTPRRLGRRFTEHVGVAPKRFGRVRRFQRLLRAVTAAAAPGPGVDWAQYAAECGYHDQAHLIHEFRAFAGMTPTAYTPRSATEPNHVPLD